MKLKRMMVLTIAVAMAGQTVFAQKAVDGTKLDYAVKKTELTVENSNPYAIFGVNPVVYDANTETKALVIENADKNSDMVRMEQDLKNGRVRIYDKNGNMISEKQLNEMDRAWGVIDRRAEKYYSTSPYAYVQNNPILNIDPNGDSIWICHEGERVLYTVGMEYSGNAFIGSVVSGLNKLSTGKFGNQMISGLQGSELNYNISEGKSSAKHNKDIIETKDGYFTGADITWDGGKLIDLGHEMGHGYDAMHGYNINAGNIMDGDDTPVSEIRGVHMENILRTEQGLPLREKYFPNNGNYGKLPLVVNGKERRFGYDYQNGNNIPWNYGNGYGVSYRPNLNIPLQPIKLR